VRANKSRESIDRGRSRRSLATLVEHVVLRHTRAARTAIMRTTTDV
jgi:hypothetical protein